MKDYLLFALAVYLWVLGGQGMAALYIHHNRDRQYSRAGLWLWGLLWPLVVPMAFLMAHREMMKVRRRSSRS